MIIGFDKDNLKKRLKTDFLCDGKVLYWAIYDFSYKYRTRIFNGNDEEVAYVEKDILEDDKVNLFDNKGKKLDEIIKTSEGYRSGDHLYTGDIDNGGIEDLFVSEDGKLSIFDDKDVLYAIMFLCGLIEIVRKD
ncbi:MAG: hypothetical protein J6Z03_05615 [Erysipelotrichaceae bacterium]|nr:hypothetical protein [Erysipelotrichaceae bacterium]